MAAADFNGDGLPDIVVSNGTSKVISLLLSVKTLNTPTVMLTSSGNTMLVGTSVAFKATVAGAAATPSGSVTLLDGSSQVGQQSLDSTGSASFTLSNLTAGTNSLTASYAGDLNYGPAVSASLNQAVTDFQVAVMPASQTVSAGTSANYTLTVTPQSGFSGAVSLACSGLPELASCNAPTIQAGGSTTAATVVVTTAASTTKMAGRVGAIAYGGLLVGCFSLYGVAARQKADAKRLIMLFPLVLGALALTLVGCSGGSAAKQITPGTPSGTSTITITATATQNGVTATHTTTATLIVQ
jgi:hypothetical protein